MVESGLCWWLWVVPAKYQPHPPPSSCLRLRTCFGIPGITVTRESSQGLPVIQLKWNKGTSLLLSFFAHKITEEQSHKRGILVKLVICVVPGHWKIKILNLKKRNKFICFFMFLYPIQGGKNIGSPYLTNKSWFFGKSDVPGQQNKSYIGVMASKNLIFLMFWLSFVYL